MKKILSSMLIILFLCFTVLLIGQGTAFRLGETGNLSSRLMKGAEQFVASSVKNMPFIEHLANELTYLSGNIRRNGIYITENYLLVDQQDHQPQRTKENIVYLKQWSESVEQPSYFVMLPTSTAIKQQELPTHIENLFNERNFISEVYHEMSDTSSTIDVYSGLFSARDQYTYYRNDRGLTALGGYYVYEALISRLGYTPLNINEFRVEHLQKNYYGELAQMAEYYHLSGDLVSFYAPTTLTKDYHITHQKPDGTMRRYYTLFPKHLMQLSSLKNAVLGGGSDQIDIVSTAKYQESCLIIGDYTAPSYLPFVANHYGRVTFLSVTAPLSQKEQIQYEEFDRVVFVLSVDTLLNHQLFPAVE